MRRLKVIFKSKLTADHPAAPQAIGGLAGKLVDADTGEELGCVQDFVLNAPMDDIVTADARLIVSEIEVT